MELELRGFASLRSKSDYNKTLSERRINSINNEMKQWAGGQLSKYIANGSLKLKDVSFGDSTAKPNVVKDLTDERNSIYNINAARERRVEIIKVNLSNCLSIKYMKVSNKIFSALKFITLVLILSIAENAGATHIVGGQLTYRHVGNNSYEVTLTLRRDCTLGQVGYDNPASIGIFSAATNTLISEVRIPFMASDTVGNTIVSKCGFIGSEVCVDRTSYRDTIDLPFLAGGYILAYQRCCRNASLNNVINPLEVGTTEWIEVTEKALLEGNSAPDFKAWPDIYICANQPLVFDHSATDADGDSLVYRICTPFDGGTFTNPRPQPPLAPHYSEILWADPYNLQNMMGGTALVIDPVTGVITANPNIIGQFLIGICVEEYRNGVLISKVRRDFQYNVRQCAEPLVADFDFAVNACDSLSYAFTNKTVDGSSYEWNFNYPSVDPAYISTEVNPTFVFPAPGVYTVRMLARSSNGACDSIVYKQLTASVGSNIPDLNLVASNLTVCPGQRVALLSASNPGSRRAREHFDLTVRPSRLLGNARAS